MRTFRDPGQLAHRFVIEQPTETPDGFGGLSIVWAAVGHVWGTLRPLSARARQLAQQTDEETTHRIILRFREDVASGWRLRMGYRTFSISTVHDPDERQRYIDCAVAEEGR